MFSDSIQMQERTVSQIAVVVAVPLWANWKSLPLPPNQKLGTISEYIDIVQNFIVSFLIMRDSYVHSVVQVTL